MFFDSRKLSEPVPKRAKLPELTARQQCILERIIRERICERMFFNGSGLEPTDHIFKRKRERNALFEDIILCLCQGKYDGNLEQGEKRNEVTFRMTGKDDTGDSLCIVLAVTVTDLRSYKSWIIKVVTVCGK